MIKRYFGGLLAALMLVTAAGIQPAAAQEQTCTDTGAIWDATRQKCVVQMDLSIAMDYPVELAQNPLIDSTVQQFLNDQRSAFLTNLTTYGLYSPRGPMYLNITYTTTPFLDQLLGLKFDVDAFAGGAHPYQMFGTFTFDLVQNRVLTLDDLFVSGADPLSVIGPLVEQSLHTQLDASGDLTWIEDGTGTNPDNYQYWQITPDALTFYFLGAQVAPDYLGPQTVSIPLTQLADLLQPRFATPAASG